jgi:ketosteroid isomerase-like protein
MAPRDARAQLYRELTRPLSDRIVISEGDLTMTPEDLDVFFGNGWNRHDVELLMTFMTDDCVFEGAAGAEVCGTRYAGRERVREAFARVFATVPDATFREARHVVAGDRGVSEWIFTGTTADGRKGEVNGCDLFTFRDGKIAVKSSYFKNRTA